MSANSLFYNEYECLNEKGKEVDKEIEQLLAPIYQRYSNSMNVRDLTGIILSVSNVLEAETILRRNIEIRKR